MTGSPTRRDAALFWVGIYRQLLAADEAALLRMRQLLATALADRREDIDQLEDVDVVLNEVERINRRLTYWYSELRGMSA